ncbi:MAG: OmpA family protein [Rickettsiales bacterium]|jgi:outer membrane protein OmpA-like peptidoglycan-associated protein|nr:OmpA family protein [Rickettsiales bacterium]
MKKLYLFFAVCSLLFFAGCAGYQTPERGTWDSILRGASFGAMTETAKIAKKPVMMGAGIEPIPMAESKPYIEKLEADLYDSLRKPGIQVQRVGNDALVVLVRDAFMSADSPEISSDGADTLAIISKILDKYNRTYIEITGYTDAMRDQNSAIALSFDMAERVALFFAQHNIRPVRMFAQGRGSARPISDQTSVGRLMNRRVEIRISPVIK